MPRNIEYLLEKYLDEGNLPQFVLTRAIACGFYPPLKILKKFGSGYGPDNFIFTHEEMLLQKLTVENELNILLQATEIDEHQLQNEIDKKYFNENTEYQRWSGYYHEDIAKLNNMNERTKTLIPKNETEVKFLKYINDYFIERKNEIDEQYKKQLIQPIKETIEQARYRLTVAKIKDLEESIENLELRLLFNDSFFKEITKRWFNK